MTGYAKTIPDNTNFTVGSLFAGIGGICKGLENAGFSVSWANEYNSKACETYEHNKKSGVLNPCTILHPVDIWNLEPETVDRVNVIAGGFPCQAFSVAGYREGFNDRKGRGNLFFRMAYFIEKLQPEAYLLENVKNLASHDQGRTIQKIKETLVDVLGYSFIPFILNSKSYGNVPQTRERIYIIGFRGESQFQKFIDSKTDSPLFNETRSGKFRIPDQMELKKTIHDCIDPARQDEKYYYVPSHQYYQELQSTMKNKDTIYQWRRIYVRENKSNVCPTLTANMGAGGHNVPLIIDDFGIRKLTPKECLNFQGFPKKYSFPQTMANSHCYMQAGNSVVVPVIERIGRSLLNAMQQAPIFNHSVEP